MEEAIKVLVQVAQLAQSKGLLSLEDTVVVLQAIKVVTPKEEEVVEE